MRRCSATRVLGLVLGLGLVAASCRTLTPVVPTERADDARGWGSATPTGVPTPAARPDAPAREGHAIVACGQRFAVEAPVVLWDEPPFYDASSTRPRFGGARRGERHDRQRRISDPALAGRVAASGWSLANLREAVDLFVLHYDACGTSRRCFEVLHDQRGLSVHFLLDVDGTLYQTLDLVGQAWHAGGAANPRSIGVEIAHVGAFAPGEHAARSAPAYVLDAGGPRLRLSADDGLRTPGFVGHPARPRPIAGVVQGQELLQWDFTPEQYATLEALTETLLEVFPRIAADVPRDASGALRRDALSPAELERFHGILGHWHVNPQKVDPGPAFDWEPFLRRVREASGTPVKRLASLSEEAAYRAATTAPWPDGEVPEDWRLELSRWSAEEAEWTFLFVPEHPWYLGQSMAAAVAGDGSVQLSSGY